MPQQFHLACIFLASGHAKRFGSNKLLANYCGRPIIETVFDSIPAERFFKTVVVTRYVPVAASALRRGYIVVENDDSQDDIAETIKRGLSVLPSEIGGCLFSVCDQPRLNAQSVHRLLDDFLSHPDAICSLGNGDRRGNPVIFPQALFPALQNLPPHHSGAAVIDTRRELLRIIEVFDPCELLDVDYPEDL